MFTQIRASSPNAPNRPWHWNPVLSMTPLERTVPERGGLNFAPMVIC